jgi:enoyl-CoA hydratase/carnithine racemase
MAVDVEVEDRVLLIRMQRPEKRNAVDSQMAIGISAALDRLDDDPNQWVGILTGTSDIFCAGTDLRDGVNARTDRGGEIARMVLVRPSASPYSLVLVSTPSGHQSARIE